MRRCGLGEGRLSRGRLPGHVVDEVPDDRKVLPEGTENYPSNSSLTPKNSTSWRIACREELAERAILERFQLPTKTMKGREQGRILEACNVVRDGRSSRGLICRSVRRRPPRDGTGRATGKGRYPDGQRGWCVAKGHQPLSEQKLAPSCSARSDRYRAALRLPREQVMLPTSGDITTSGCQPSQRQLSRKKRSYVTDSQSRGEELAKMIQREMVSVHRRVPLCR